MKKSVLTSILLFLCVSFISAQPIPTDSLYFGQNPPGDSAVLFAPGRISLPGRNEPCITFSSDGKTAFFYIEFYPSAGNPYIMFTEYENDHWSIPDTVSFSAGRKCGEPFFAFGGNRLYMFASNAINHQGVVDLCYSEKQAGLWSIPISLGDPPNSESYQYHPSIVGDSSIYFSSNSGNICKSQYSNGAYLSRVILPKPVNYVGSQTWGDPYVAQDESYMIFKSIRVGGFGQNDIYIAYRKPDGSWTNPKNLGSKINTSHDETSGDITPDGKYMTFGSNKDLYWVSTSFIDSLRFTNFIPYVKNPIADKVDTVGQLFSFTIPDSTFIDDDGNNTLVFHAGLSNGNQLPSWLTFDTLTRNFAGTPSEIETLILKVTATDDSMASVSTTFKLLIKEPSAIQEINAQTLKCKVFPNPTHNIVNISLEELKNKSAIVEVRSLVGQLVLDRTFKNDIQLDLMAKPKGTYFVKVTCEDKIFFSIICLN